MGRHSRRGPAATAGDTSGIAEVGEADGSGAAAGAVPAPGPGTGRRRRGAQAGSEGGGEAAEAGGAGSAPHDATRFGEFRQTPRQRTPEHEPAQGALRYGTGARVPGHEPAAGAPWPPPAQRTPRNAPAQEAPGSTPAQGTPRVPRPRDGRPAAGHPAAGPVTGRPATEPAAGHPAGAPQSPPATPAHGFTPFGDGSEGAARPAPGAGSGPALGPTSTGTGTAGSPFVPQGRAPTPRQEYVDAFETAPGGPRPAGPANTDDDVFAAGAPESGPGRSTGRSVVFPREGDGAADEPDGDLDAAGPGAQEPRTGSGSRPGAGPGPGRKTAKSRTFTGVAAAAVTTVLAVVVAGQVTEQQQEDSKAQAMGEKDRAAEAASRSNTRPTQQAAPASYDQKMAKVFPLDEKLAASGQFKPTGGDAKAPGHGRVLRYRVDVEDGMGLDGQLFADAVHKTLNDERSWAHGGRRTFQRVGSGDADFVITLASPGTTGKWCAKSGLDTTEDNVSCDSAATERVMINAYRWAQGAKTYGPDKMHAYRQMLINHEVGHRLGRNHESCGRQGALAPVMMQQTKFLTTDGATCRPNAWPFPDGH
ncbi:DUF3152 domain-containing protein [Streptomyces sp. NPDC059788]|uniref:DUF3152 domain-containing protein n=1 Tax=Streptomyces sp. NPDC059788 TaxID=3346948 RepID=UPI003646FDE0